MHVVLGGASGFLGTALTTHLRDQHHQVTRLVRSEDPRSDASLWDPRTGRIDQIVIDRADAVVNLSGASIGRWPRTSSYKRELMRSRVDPTTTLARAIAGSGAPPMLLSGSAMGIYGGDRGDDVLTEQSELGDDFPAQIATKWEAAAQPAVDAGARVVFLRTALVLDQAGGLLGPLLPLFKLGLGGRLGSGRQHMSLVSLTDWLRAVTFLLENPDASGPYNIVMPADVTNAQFTDAFGDALHRPTVMVAPRFALRGVLGEMANDLLGSLRMQPARLREAGFDFEHPDLESAMRSALA